MMRHNLFVLASSLFVGLSSQAPGRHPCNETFGPLRFKKDGSFQLSIFEDLHFGENPWNTWGPQQDINSIKVLEKVLDFDRPDLAVLNGDLITGENTYLHNSTHLMDQIAKPFVDRRVSWASTYGNHDHQPNLAGVDLLAREHLFPNSRTLQMVEGRNAGVSNYYLPVFPAHCTKGAAEGCAPELLLWFFDSRGGFYFQEWHEDGSQVGQPNWVDESVVSWFRQTHTELLTKYKRVIPSLAFVHIPTNASLALQDSGVSPNYQPGVNDDRPLAQQAQGWCPDGTDNGSCRYGGQDTPFMEAITTLPGVMGLFSGHDHGNTWCYKWDRLLPGMTVPGNGINICFGQHSGYGGYGNWIRGARQIRVTKESLRQFEMDTWIRLESGDSVGSVTLNATYNQDFYPATPNDQTYCPTCNYTVVTPKPDN